MVESRFIMVIQVYRSRGSFSQLDGSSWAVISLMSCKQLLEAGFWTETHPKGR